VVHVVGGSTTFERNKPKKPAPSPQKKAKASEMAEDANVACGKRFRFQRIMNDGDDDDQPQYLSNEDEPGKAKKRLKRTLDDTP
jgi:hypothetical protein